MTATPLITTGNVVEQNGSAGPDIDHLTGTAAFGNQIQPFAEEFPNTVTEDNVVIYSKN